MTIAVMPIRDVYLRNSPRVTVLLTQSEIRDHKGRNKPAYSIDQSQTQKYTAQIMAAQVTLSQPNYGETGQSLNKAE
jgi:hypothetical protein